MQLLLPLLPLALPPVCAIQACFNLTLFTTINLNAHMHLHMPCNFVSGLRQRLTKATCTAHQTVIIWSVLVDSTFIRQSLRISLRLEWHPRGCKAMTQSPFSISSNLAFQLGEFQTAYALRSVSYIFRIILGSTFFHSRACATAWFLLVIRLMTTICAMISWHIGIQGTPLLHYLFGETRGMQGTGKSQRALHINGNGYFVTHQSCLLPQITGENLEGRNPWSGK